MKISELFTTSLLIFCIVTISTPTYAACRYYKNISGNFELKCDYIHEYPDYNRSDDHDINPGAWNRGHEAGYEWAQDNNIVDSSDCTGYSRSFVEGCMRAVEELEEDEEEEDYDY